MQRRSKRDNCGGGVPPQLSSLLRHCSTNLSAKLRALIFLTIMANSISIETLCLLIGTYPILTVKYDYKMLRVCLRFELPIENTNNKSGSTDGQAISVAVYIRAQ